MNKFITIFLLFMMLVVFPLGSYLYLSKGVDYRLAALDMVKPKGELVDFNYYVNSNSYSKKSLANKTTLISLNRNEENDKYLNMIYDQFKQSSNLVLLQVVNDSIVESTSGFTTVYSPESSILRNAYSNQDIVLIDTALQVRSYYALNDSTVNEIVRDIAVVLPLKKKSTIKMTDR